MYQVLYRKYRPKVFTDVYGQDHITSTLINEIKENRVSHAYLFTGSRGTGKTTCSKILAKAVNCEHPIDGEPCNECEICKGIDDETIFDVVEIDAASNNGVENIRDIREEVNYTPSKCKYRVYIIDEVHMLSQGAFNALLKTLEEPPAHVIFILATTEVHKLPATILSRCQRFDFKRIQVETMSKRLNQVAEMEGLKLDDEASTLISRISDGGMRDALSLLDQCASKASEITADVVSNVAGIANTESLYRLTEAIASKNSNSAIEIISELHQNSYDMERLCVEMINHFRNYLLVKTVNKNRSLIISTDDEYNRIVDDANKFTLPNIIFILDLFQSTLTKIKSGANARVEMEMTFIRLCEPKLEVSNDSILSRLSTLENAIKRGVVTAPSISQTKTVETKQDTKEQPVIANVEPDVSTKEEETTNETNTKTEDANPPIPEDPIAEPPKAPIETPQEFSTEQVEFDRWAEFLELMHTKDIGMFGILSNSRAYIRGEHFLIKTDNPTVNSFIRAPLHAKAIREALFEITGIKYKLGILKDKNEKKVERDALEDLIAKAQNNNLEIEIK